MKQWRRTPSDGGRQLWEEIAISTHLRIAAGACVLSTGLMVGGGGMAIAAAAPETGGSATNTQGGPGPKKPAVPTHPLATFAEGIRNALKGTVDGVSGTLSSLPKPPAVFKVPKTTFGGTPTVHGSTGSASAAQDDASPAVITPPTPAPSAPVYVAPNPIVATSGTFAPIVNSVTAAATTIISVPAIVASLPTSAAPVSDVIASIESIVTSVADAGTSISQLPADLSGLLGVGTTIPTATIGAGTGLPRQFGVTASPVAAPAFSALPSLLPLSSPGGGSVARPLVGPEVPSSIAATSVTPTESSPESTLPTPQGDESSDVLSMVEHAIGAFVATVSLTALAAMAFPGIAGLLTTCIAGVRLGYRQAKAGSELPDTVISRFVGSGPVGIVRSSSQVELRPGSSRVVRPESRDAAATPVLRLVRAESASATQLLDQAV